MIHPKRSFSRYLNIRKLHPVAITAQDTVNVFFNNGEDQYDITDFHALISLKPFTIAINAAAIKFLNPENGILHIATNETLLGKLHLQSAGLEKFNGNTLCIFEAKLSYHPLSFFAALWNSILLSLKNSTNKKSQNFVVPPKDLLKLFVFSLKPRPVFLVSVQHQNGFDVFPVDIAGCISDTHRIFSIRTTSAAIPHILATKKICSSSVPYEQRHAVYQLGRHHAGGIIPQEAATMEFIPSTQWKIPVPAFAIQTNELLLEHTFQKGVHSQFIFRVANSYQLNTGLELGYTPWFNRNYFKNSFDLPK
ncbi:MAG: hypothetical protein WBB36_04500 [Chitinophagales bacterium]